MTPYGVGSRNTPPISWIKAARKDFQAFPEGAQDQILQALTIAAEGGKSDIAKPLKGLGSGVFEVAVRYRTDAYRTVYAVQFASDIWVLHAFQKKSTKGVKMLQKDAELIKSRLKRLMKELK